MTKLFNHILSLIMILPVAAGVQSCSDDLQESGDVSVRFIAKLPVETGTRSFGNAGRINNLVVGIFDEQKTEIERKTFAVNGSSFDVQLTLAQNQVYNVIFWAYDNSQDIYDINDLTAIRMNALPDSLTFDQSESADAFFAAIENLPVLGDRKHMVEMVRPLAQINVGTTEEVLQTSVKFKGVPDTFYPFTNTVSSGTADFTWRFCGKTSEKLSVDGNEYNYLALCYLFAPDTVTHISTEITLTRDEQVSRTVELPHVEVNANCRSNILGSFVIE